MIGIVALVLVLFAIVAALVSVARPTRGLIEAAIVALGVAMLLGGPHVLI